MIRSCVGMGSSLKIKRSNDFGMTTFEVSGEKIDIQLRILSRLDKRQRRVIVRSFITQFRPWIKSLGSGAIGHANHGAIINRRTIQRGARPFFASPITTLRGAVGFEIRMKRLEFGISQAQLAKRLEIQRSHLSDIERGIHLPNSSTRRKIEEVLGITVTKD